MRICHPVNRALDTVRRLNIPRFYTSILSMVVKAGAIALLVVACNPVPRDVRELVANLEANDTSFLETIRHYRDLGEQDKLEALYFLIRNMDAHFHVENEIRDPRAYASIPFDVSTYQDAKAVEKGYDSLIQKNLMIKSTVQDVRVITSDILIRNIDLAFTVKNARWSRNLDFQDFCEYILPYRAYHEPLEDWRPKLYQSFDIEYFNRLDNITQITKVMDSVMKRSIKWDYRSAFQLEEQGISELEKTTIGTCGDLAVYATCALRSMGIPVALDYVPYWGHTKGSHIWNVIFDSLGNAHHFQGGLEPVGEYQILKTKTVQPPKIFRHTYSKQIHNPEFNNTGAPDIFEKGNFIDVTNHYYPTSDVVLQIENTGSSDLIFLCVFNGGKWKPVYYGHVSGSKVTFKGMGRGNIYIPARYEGNRLQFIHSPFKLKIDGEIEFIEGKGKEPNLQNTKLSIYNQGVWLLDSIQEETSYDLFVWKENQWELFEHFESGNSNFLIVPQMPSDGLFIFDILSQSAKTDDLRFFVLENDKQVFW